MGRESRGVVLADVEPWDRWVPGSYSREELADALLAGGIAGTVTSHDRHNVRWKIKRMVHGDPEGQFGLTGLEGVTADQVLSIVGAAAGFDPDPLLRDDPVPIDPYRVLDALEASGDRLARAAERGERVVFATGHPVGLIRFYRATARLVAGRGARVLTPAGGRRWREEGRHREIVYRGDVAVVNDGQKDIHTHRPDAMRRMLDAVVPDLVFADHGLAGAAIQSGVETISIADINDPALVVAKHQGRTEIVVVMDDNVRPDDYWPCFQAVASRFP